MLEQCYVAEVIAMFLLARGSFADVTRAGSMSKEACLPCGASLLEIVHVQMVTVCGFTFKSLNQCILC